MTDSSRGVLVAASNFGGGIARHLELLGTSIDIELVELPETISLPAKIAKLRRRLRERGPCLIVTHGVAAGLAARMRTRRHDGYRHVEIWHGDPFFLTPWRRIPHHLLARVGIAPDVQMFVNPALLGTYADKRSTIVVIPNSVPVGDHVARRAEMTRRVVYMGRLSPEKGYEDLLAAWPRDSGERGWRLDVYGAGELSGVPVPESVQVHGITADPMAEITSADVVVVPSWTEASPYVALEALSVATPLIATRTGDMPELLGSGCGWLVEPRDVAGLRTALETAQSCSDADRGALGERGREWLRTQRPFEAWIGTVSELYRTGRAPTT
jgi:glycosyltransferase involved in cell wall biosynthesis